MSRGGSFGGGQSSLGYLFGSDEKKTPPPPSPSPSPSPSAVCIPPYGIEIPQEKPRENPSTPEKQSVDDVGNSNNYPRVQGQNSGNFITGRPWTKVKSVPGGDSSLGYLFGDK